eukprot:4095065-Pyramimonas_sp.AAC.1
MLATEFRASFLRSAFGFTCLCPRCQGGMEAEAMLHAPSAALKALPPASAMQLIMAAAAHHCQILGVNPAGYAGVTIVSHLG